jgi:hypothetical protein
LINFYYENRYKLYVLVADALYFIAKAIEKYNNVFEYFKKNKSKIEWVKQYYVELIENKFADIIDKETQKRLVIKTSLSKIVCYVG